MGFWIILIGMVIGGIFNECGFANKRKCGECGRVINSNDGFCGGCGMKLKGEEE